MIGRSVPLSVVLIIIIGRMVIKMNKKYIQSHNQRTFHEEKKVDEKTFLYTLGVTMGLFGIAYVISTYSANYHHNNDNDRSFTNRLERVTK